MTSTRLEVYIQPRASRTELAGMYGGALKIRIAAPPVDNAANRELVELVRRARTPGRISNKWLRL